MTYEHISMTAERLRDHLQGSRLVGLMLPREASRAMPWTETDSPVPWTPFETVYRAGPVRLPFLGNDLDPERRMDAVRVLRMLSAEVLLVVVGCHARTGHLKPGSFVIIDDHVNSTGENPLRGPNDERLGPRYPDMSEPYDAHWTLNLKRTAASLGLGLQHAVFGRVGPAGTGDVPAAWIHAGISVVGEGLLDEVVAAVHCGLPVVAVGIVEKGWPDDGNALCSVPVRNEVYGQLAELIKQSLLCRGGMDDG